MRYFLILPVFFFVFSCKESVDNVSKNEATSASAVEDSIVPDQVIKRFVAPALPNEILFANENIDLTDIDIRERFDREIVVNNFWHSNTLFYIKRANRWFPKMKEILQEENVPSDFVYLAVIESGLHQVTSPSGARGFWQFMPETAKEYQLTINDEIDERYHIEKSTRAAAKYLKKAYDQFGSWILAAASYNRGRGGIKRDLEMQYGTNFFDLHLNDETSRYVFRILAVKHIMEYPAEFGFYLDDVSLYPEFNVKKVVIQNTVDDLPKWAIDHGVNLKILKKLNPWILTNTLTVKSNDQIEILLPDGGEQLRPYKRS